MVQPLDRKLEPHEIQRLNELDEKQYVLLLEFNDGVKDFEFKTGRIETYNYLKLIVEDIDIHNSRILADTMLVKDAKKVSIYRFFKLMEGVMKDTFNIDDYAIGDDIYDEE
ncbi:MAG: hypothetical protein ACRCXT_11395 [Paraclostridium sp.]